MPKPLYKFRVDQGIHGAVIMSAAGQLTPGCISDGEIDTCIQLLKEELDACRREMKRLRKDRKALFARPK
jgi:hypothetical protein